MVFYFTSTTKAGTFTIYMGRDKHENELLIQHGWPEDVWFHVDDLSSAHVYLRLPEGMYVKQIPAEVLADCAQLVKANSIEGNKKATGGVKIVYTLWANLLKNGSMAIGQVGFKNGRDIYYTNADTRDNAIVNRLNKTRVEKDTSEIKASKDAREAELRAREKAAKRAAAEDEKRVIEERKRDKAARSYDTVFDSRNMISNAEVNMSADQYEDDFM